MSGLLLSPNKSRPRMRRVSSHEATSEMLARGPSVVVPPKHLMAPSDSHEIAASMEHARHQLRDLDHEVLTEEDSGSSGTSTPRDTHVTDKYAFAFDIDGVLIRGGRPIPEAIEAMKVLNGQNEYGIKIPYIFVTNGGGKTEQERCIQLSKQLEIEVSPGQFICGHTPMREMADRYSTVLVVGGEGEQCRAVAEGYGFRDVVTPGDIIKHDADTTPFRKLTPTEHASSRTRDWSSTRIEAIFVFADSRDWAGDQQIILDLLLSQNGVLGTRSASSTEGPPVFFSHNDVVWSASHDLVRLGMGALRCSLEAMYGAVTGGKTLVTTAFGKPQTGTFEFATRLLREWRRETHGIDAAPDTVYFVGDTPESDVRGTNDYDAHVAAGRAGEEREGREGERQTWYSILVRTGVYQAGTEPKYKPRATVDNVLDAVWHAIDRERKKLA